ncbi:hypothetical protein ACMFMF_011962 [Clarireedia jacksonii]
MPSAFDPIPSMILHVPLQSHQTSLSTQLKRPKNSCRKAQEILSLSTIHRNITKTKQGREPIDAQRKPRARNVPCCLRYCCLSPDRIAQKTLNQSATPALPHYVISIEHYGRAQREEESFEDFWEDLFSFLCAVWASRDEGSSGSK